MDKIITEENIHNNNFQSDKKKGREKRAYQVEKKNLTRNA